MALGCVGVAGSNQGLDEGDHAADVAGRPRLDVGIEGAESPHILMIGADGALGEDVDGLAVVGRRLDDLVVHVGDVADVGHRGVEALQQPVEHVEHHHRPGIADVGEVIDRRPADIEPDPTRLQRFETILAARESVVNIEGHAGVIRVRRP